MNFSQLDDIQQCVEFIHERQYLLQPIAENP